MWRAHFIEAPWPNFCHGPSIFMILSHISLIENFSMTLDELLLYQAIGPVKNGPLTVSLFEQKTSSFGNSEN